MKVISKIHLIIGLLIIANCSLAQNPTPKNYAVLELGGAGNVFSLNYERNILTLGKNTILPKIGLTYFPMYVNGEATVGTFGFPFGIKYLYSINESNHNTEVCFENMVSVSVDNLSYSNTRYDYGYSLTPSLGYRYEKTNSKSIVIYMGYSPRIYFLRIPLRGERTKFQHYLKIGVGYKF